MTSNAPALCLLCGQERKFYNAEADACEHTTGLTKPQFNIFCGCACRFAAPPSSSPVTPSLTPEQERETLIYWLLRAYQSGHREGWEPGPSTDETMDGLLSVLANRGYDPSVDKAAKELLKRPARYDVAPCGQCGGSKEVAVGCAIDTALTVPCPSCSGMPRRWCSVHNREEFKYESLEHELHAAPPSTQPSARVVAKTPDPRALFYTARQLRDDVVYQYLGQSPEPGLFEFLNWLIKQEKIND